MAFFYREEKASVFCCLEWQLSPAQPSPAQRYLKLLKETPAPLPFLDCFKELLMRLIIMLQSHKLAVVLLQQLFGEGVYEGGKREGWQEGLLKRAALTPKTGPQPTFIEGAKGAPLLFPEKALVPVGDQLSPNSLHHLLQVLALQFFQAVDFQAQLKEAVQRRVEATKHKEGRAYLMHTMFPWQGGNAGESAAPGPPRNQRGPHAQEGNPASYSVHNAGSGALHVRSEGVSLFGRHLQPVPERQDAAAHLVTHGLFLSSPGFQLGGTAKEQP